VASYQFGPARVYANYSRVKQDLKGTPTVATATLANAQKVDIYEIGTAYSLSPSLKLLAAVDHTRATFNGVNGKGKLTQISLGADYWLSKRTDLYAFVANMRASDIQNPGVTGGATGSDASQTAVITGIRHKF
jgi:predicted porin